MNQIPDAKVNYWLKIAGIVLAICLSITIFADRVLPILGQTVNIVAPLILPFILAFVLSVLLDPLISFLERRFRFKRTLAVVVSLLIVLLVIALLFGALISRLIIEINALAVTLSNINIDVDQVQKAVEAIYSKFLVNIADMETIKQGIQSFLATFSDISVSFLNGLVSVLKSTPSTFVMLLVTVFATYFFCKDKVMVLNFFMRLTPKGKKGKTQETYDNTLKAFSGYFRAQIIVISVTMILCMIGYGILGLDYVFTMGILTGVFDVLPVLGPGTIIIPWAVWSFVSGDVGVGVGLIVIYAIITISRQFLEPKLVSANIGLHPLATLAAIFIGMRLFGIVGLICGPIVLVIISGFFKASKDTL